MNPKDLYELNMKLQKVTDKYAVTVESLYHKLDDIVLEFARLGIKVLTTEFNVKMTSERKVRLLIDTIDTIDRYLYDKRTISRLIALLLKT